MPGHHPFGGGDRHLQGDVHSHRAGRGRGAIVNTATANGTSGGNPAVSPPFSEATPTAQLAGAQHREAGHDLGPLPRGPQVQYAYTVQNTGGQQLTGSQITDNHVTGITCDATTLQPDTITTCRVSYFIPEADGQAGGVTHRAQAAAEDPAGKTIADDPATVTITSKQREIKIRKIDAKNSGPLRGAQFEVWTETNGIDGIQTRASATVLADTETGNDCSPAVSGPASSEAWPSASTTCWSHPRDTSSPTTRSADPTRSQRRTLTCPSP